MKRKTFSIIMPVWNRTNIVKRSIESILSQTFEDYELLIIDDGSEDDLERAVYPYLSENVLYFKIPHSGASAARNYGIKKAKGEFIAYLDSDNTWHKEFPSKMHHAISASNDKKEMAYCMCNFFEKNRESGNIQKTKTVGKEFNFNELLKENYIDLNSLIHTRKCIEFTGFFDEKLKRLNDWDFIIRITSRFEPLFVPEILVDYYYGITDNAISIVENFKVAYEHIGRKKVKYKKPIEVFHDRIKYVFKDVPDKKYYNWLKMISKDLNTSNFLAWGYPYILQIEPTSICNLDCPLCPTGRKELGREYRHMTLNEFKPIIDDMESYLLFLVLWDWGEPLMNPELPAMVRYAAERGIKTVTSTNSHFFDDEEYLAELLRSGLSTLIVAIDSLYDKQYQIYRKKGNLSKAITGLKKVLALKKNLNSDTIINMRMVIMKQNEHELKEMRNMAKKLKVDKFTVKTLNPSCGLIAMDKELVPVNPKYRRFKYKKGTYERIRQNEPCRRVWQTSNIFSNGDVAPCCWDYNSEMKAGNVFETPFSKIWNSPAYRELRKRIYYEKDQIPKCGLCTLGFKYSNKDWFVEVHDFNKENITERILNKIANPNRRTSR